MVSVSFGNYGSALLFRKSSSLGWSKVLSTAVALALAAVNIASARFIDRVQSAIVVVLLAVFAIFIVVTFAQIDPQLLATSTYPPAVDVLLATSSSVNANIYAATGSTANSPSPGCFRRSSASSPGSAEHVAW
jgi:amino acid permease